MENRHSYSTGSSLAIVTPVLEIWPHTNGKAEIKFIHVVIGQLHNCPSTDDELCYYHGITILIRMCSPLIRIKNHTWLASRSWYSSPVLKSINKIEIFGLMEIVYGLSIVEILRNVSMSDFDHWDITSDLINDISKYLNTHWTIGIKSKLRILCTLDKENWIKLKIYYTTESTWMWTSTAGPCHRCCDQFTATYLICSYKIYENL